jgi:hypothetical protein
MGTAGRSIVALLIGLGLVVGLIGAVALGTRRGQPRQAASLLSAQRPRRAGRPRRHAVGAPVRTLAWCGLTGGVLFFGLTSAQQRDHLVRAVQTGRARLGQLYRDSQGYREDL